MLEIYWYAESHGEQASLSPWTDQAMCFLFRGTKRNAENRKPSVRSPAQSHPMQDAPSPEDLSLGLLVYVGPTAGGRSLRDEAWNTAWSEGRMLHTLRAKVGLAMIASAIYRTMVVPPLNRRSMLKKTPGSSKRVQPRAQE
jgi:hypothetical protein